MLTVAEIIQIIDECRIEAEQGLGNGSQAVMDEITVDFLKPPSDFLGVQNNPAIFINASTYKYLQRFHKNWIVNRTIAVKIEIFNYPKINIVGIVAHETGHAFNIAAGIINSEDNAYIFEIEILTRWFMMKNKIVSDISKGDLLDYFQTRMPYYKASAPKNDYLLELLQKIENNTILSPSTDAEPSNAPTQALDSDARDTWLRFYKLSENKKDPPSMHKEKLCKL